MRRSNVRTLCLVAAGALLAGVAYDFALELRLRTRAHGRLTSRLVGPPDQQALCLEAGVGSPVLIVPSMLLRARSYLPLLARLSRTHRVIALELPGTGRAVRVPSPLSFVAYAARIADFIADEHLEDVVLIGHSNSGPVAMHVAADLAPERVARLILADSVGARTRRGVARVVGARCVDALQEPWLNLRGWWHVLLNAARHPRTFARQVWYGANANTLALAARVQTPTLLVWGRYDGTMPRSCAYRLLRWMPHAELAIGPGSHDGLMARPRGFAALIDAWLNSDARHAAPTGSASTTS